MTTLSAFESAAIKAALQDLAHRNYFNICTVDGILSVLGIPQGGRTYRALRLLHCVHYGDMDRELIEALPEELARLFAQPYLDINRINIVVSPDRSHLRIVQNG